MADAANPLETLIGRIAADPAMAFLAKSETAVLVWDRAVERLLWASPAAEGLRDSFADPTGRLRPGLKARDRLKTLAEGSAPWEGSRLERLRLDPSRPWLPVSCACRLAFLENGEIVLVTALVGSVPKGAGRPHSVEAQAAAPTPSEPALPLPEPESKALAPEEMQGPVRFVWQADAQTRFTQVSPALAEVVGPMAADIVGLTWDEVARSVVEDPDGAVAALFAQRRTWSGRSIAWSMDNAARQVPVDWAGMPVFGPDRELVGFRGFGLLRLDSIREKEPRASASRSAPPREAGIPPSEGDDNWFSNLRDKVAEALSSTKPVEPEEPVEAVQLAAPPVSSLSIAERNAFREIARALGARFEDEANAASEEPEAPAEPQIPYEVQAIAEELPPEDPPTPAFEEEALPPPPATTPGDRILDRLPIGVLVHREEEVLFANRFLLQQIGFEDVEQIRAAGGLVSLFRGSPVLEDADDEGSPLALTTHGNETVPVSVRLAEAEWDGAPASLMVIRPIPGPTALQRARESRIHELEAILDTATDGVIVLDETGRILSLNRSAEALFGYDQKEVVGDAITVLLAPESHIVALGYLDGLRSPGVAGLLNDGREVLGRVRQGGTIPLFMTMGHVSDGPDRKFCAVLRDITTFKKAEGELVGAKRAAEEASAQKSDLLAKISHEIRTPLNAIIGFAEVMLEERFGPIGNERYRDYLKDVHSSGAHVISLVNDLLDLAKVEAGRLELAFTSVNLNDLVSACVTLLQPQAARERIVMRTSFAPKLPPVVADERSMRQIALNLVSNAVKFTDAGGQVIVSTALTDRGEVAFRVRDTGIGMSEQEVETALEPFRQLATARRRGGTGLGLPLTKALVEANRGSLKISSQPNEGTLVEVIFPPTRVLAE